MQLNLTMCTRAVTAGVRVAAQRADTAGLRGKGLNNMTLAELMIKQHDPDWIDKIKQHDPNWIDKIKQHDPN